VAPAVADTQSTSTEATRHHATSSHILRIVSFPKARLFDENLTGNGKIRLQHI